MKNWRERAFLRAELIENGIRTVAVETAKEAGEWVSDERILPMIVIYDNRSQENSSEDIGYLQKHLSSFPILILAGVGEKNSQEFKNSGFDHILLRPVNIGTIVERTKEIIMSVVSSP
jgi:hypothetical protein